jgi:hypothetical protein
MTRRPPPGRSVILAAIAGAAVLMGAPSAVALTSFATPSRNIGCIGDRTEVRCDIRQTSAPPPPKPASRPFDWGDAFSVRPTGRGRGVCHSDTALPAPGRRIRILAYGTSITLGKITCTSRRSGLTCRNPGGHGFFLSREKIRVF